MGRQPIPAFPPATLTFLRALARHNDRDWFRDRKDEYERHVRAPMLALIERIDADLRRFAPDLVASPKVSLFRIYRDTRFSADKSPFKTQVGALFPHRVLGRMSGAGLYVEIGPKGTLIAGGVHAPSGPETRAIRAHIAENLSRLRSIVEAPSFGRITGGLGGDQLSRVPRGFPADHPAADYLRYKQWLVWVDHPAAFASSPDFYPTVVEVFRAAAPLVAFLNEPLLTRRADPLR
jgi:uncharacterized protein (TIGR02453 family)